MIFHGSFPEKSRPSWPSWLTSFPQEPPLPLHGEEAAASALRRSHPGGERPPGAAADDQGLEERQVRCLFWWKTIVSDGL